MKGIPNFNNQQNYDFLNRMTDFLFDIELETVENRYRHFT